MTAPATDAARTRGRLMLIALFVLFFGSAFGAGVLRFAGWMPDGLKNHGSLLHPALDLRDHTPTLADGSAYAWNPQARTWRILALGPTTACDPGCDQVLAQLDKVWRLFGHNADQVQILWMGHAPASAASLPELRLLGEDAGMRARLPGAGDGGVPLYVIDPNGFVVLHYPPGADPAGVRSDVARLLKLK
jgi:cytochrome oxidase Cu insertion factor (SCO1/SenC/PrrC family)